MSSSDPRPVPALSIGLPVYNGERYLESALDTLLAQTFEDFELIISDNASTDRTAEICRGYADRDSRIRYYRNETNRGATYNQIRVVDLARAPLFALANDDDLWAPSYYEACIRALRQKPDAVLAYARAIQIDPAGKVIGPLVHDMKLNAPKPQARLRRYHRLYCEFDKKRLWETQVPQGLWTIVYGVIRTEAVRRTSWMGAFISADTVALEELMMGGPLVEVAEPLFYKREHPGQSMKACEAFDKRIEWWTGDKGSRFLFPHWRLFYERIKAAAKAPLPLGARLLCMAEMVAHYFRRGQDFRVLGTELWLNARALFGRKPLPQVWH